MLYVLAFVAGGIAVGLVAHKWPSLFNSAVAAIDDAAKDAAAKVRK